MKKFILLLLTTILLTSCSDKAMNSMSPEPLPSQTPIEVLSIMEPVEYTNYPSCAFPGYVLLTRPANSSITITLIATTEVYVLIEYYSDNDLGKTNEILLKKDLPEEFLITTLEPNKEYSYRLIFKEADIEEYSASEYYDFNTGRVEGETFTFSVQSDSHLRNKADRPVYLDVMNSIKDFNPDLFFILGDTFLNDEIFNISYDEVDALYYDQLNFLGVPAATSPLFLVIGNHEGEYGYYNTSQDSLPAYSGTARKITIKTRSQMIFTLEIQLKMIL